MKYLALCFSLSIMLPSCSVNNSEVSQVTCNGNSISFTNEVKPLIDTYCATNSGCHASGSHEGPGALTTYAQIFSARTIISSAVSSGRMPEGTSLTSSQRATIVCWIQNGAQQ